RDLLAFIRRLDAPVIMACGDHDDVGLYSERVSPSPIGVVRIGRHRCIILYDHPAAPIDRDTDQLAWVERTLQSPGFDGLTIVVAHDDRPNLLAHWRSSGTLAERLRRGRIGLWLAGGHRDWDGVAFAELLRAAGPLRYVRT